MTGQYRNWRKYKASHETDSNTRNATVRAICHTELSLRKIPESH